MANATAKLGPMLRALSHRNYRLFFAGQSISLIGTWMQQIAMSWLVYEMTRNALLLGVIGFAGQIPTFFIAPFAGVLVDRWNRHRLLVATQTLAMIQAFVLAALALSGTIEVWQLIVLSVFLGVINAFDMTGRQAFLTEMVTRKEDLANAIALNSSMVNGARLVGPSLAGLLLAATNSNAGVCFLINGLSYLAVIAALLAMRVEPRARPARATHLVQGLKEGFTYAFGFAPIRALLLLLALVSFVGMPYTILMPVFATDVLHGGPDTLGFLMTASGVGALAGAMYLASRQTVLGLGFFVAMAPVAFGLGLIVFAFSQVVWVSLLLLFVTGFAFMVQMASSNTILQTIVEEDKRGRVMSFYTMAFMGMAPLGSLLAGFVAERVGAPLTLAAGGLGCIVGGLAFTTVLPALRQRVRPLYIRLGILPQVASGLQAVSELTVPPESE
jgi:MFS family permease